jgi:hypothetical protein
MRKIIFILAILISGIGIWIYPYIAELRDQGLTADMAYDYFFSGPDHPFDPNDAVDQLDYAKTSSWASLPSIKDEADFFPAGEEGVDQANAEVDVFFIHPTGYLKGDHWTDPLEKQSVTKENTQWMMANQASAYNGCCSIYAPHYRQASIYSYFGTDQVRAEVHGFVYQDVKKHSSTFLITIARADRLLSLVIAKAHTTQLDYLQKKLMPLTFTQEWLALTSLAAQSPKTGWLIWPT